MCRACSYPAYDGEPTCRDQCVTCGHAEVIEGHQCISCRETEVRREEWWADA